MFTSHDPRTNQHQPLLRNPVFKGRKLNLISPQRLFKVEKPLRSKNVPYKQIFSTMTMTFLKQDKMVVSMKGFLDQ